MNESNKKIQEEIKNIRLEREKIIAEMQEEMKNEMSFSIEIENSEVIYKACEELGNKEMSRKEVVPKLLCGQYLKDKSFLSN